MANDRAVTEPPFSRRSSRLLGVAAGGSLLLALLLLVYRGDGIDRISVQADSYSNSALGHRALFELLRALGRPVVQSRHAITHRGAGNALLVLAEPHLDGDLQQRLVELVAGAGKVLLVLPKRDGSGDADRPRWIGTDFELPADLATKVLQAAGITGTVQRRDAARLRASCPLPVPQIAAPQLLTPLGGKQLIGSAEGTLLGAYTQKGKRVYVLADPDPIANHGIDDGDNAAFAVGMLDLLRDGAPIVLDETLHGWEQQPSVWTELGHFPLVLLLAHLLLLLAAVLWFATGRYGSPLPVAPAIAPGNAFLIDNIAALLDHAGHAGASLQRFAADRVRTAARALHAPPLPDTGAMVLWLAQRGRAGAQLDQLVAEASTLASGGDARTALALAQTIHRTTEELVHGRD
ncbi:MAG TPA: DUF4350 domain-containing protein [Planctomycetota bacterium]|nr:DUF4350 domain-containing protein [Planctomycetota bacterium]